MNDLKDKVAYITGGSKGIGYGIAKTLLGEGMRVAISSRTLFAAKEASASLSNDPSRILALQSDVCSMASEAESVREVVNRFGQLDLLVVNAGVGHFSSIDTLTEEEWKQTIDTNLTGVFNSVKASIDALKKSSGYIITIASLAGVNFFENGSAYNASKFGLVGFTQAIMLDLRKHGIKSLQLCRDLLLLISMIIHHLMQMHGKYNRKISGKSFPIFCICTREHCQAR
ncbi:MAG: SDR family NAD(P)-dependent oxidoreductase [Chitinophagaceae bacterium]